MVKRMKKPVITAFFLYTALCIIGCSQDSNPISDNGNTLVNTSNDLQFVSTAYIYSDASDKKGLTLIYFRSNTCEWGDSLEENTFTDPSVIQAINQNCNIALVNTSSDTLIYFYDSLMTGNELFKLYNLVGVPSFLLLNKECDYVGRIRGYKPPEEFIGELNYFLGVVE